MPDQSSDTPGCALPVVHVLLASYRGREFIAEQLDSIARQTYTRWTLTISDDGSDDGTADVCRAFADRYPQGQVTLLQGPRQGSKANFFHLISQAPDHSPQDCFAFSDQDDVWLPSKLHKAMTTLQAMDERSGAPLLYCGRTQLVNESLRPIGLGLLPGRPLGFGNALLQNVASGNTMVFNRPLLALLRKVAPSHSVWHDWTAYQLVTGCRGQIHFDPVPQVLYRQHPENIIGSQNRSMDKLQRARMILDGVYRRWGDLTEQAMQDVRSDLSPQALELLGHFHDMRSRSGALGRLQAGWSGGLWRQTRSGQMVFLATLACGLI